MKPILYLHVSLVAMLTYSCSLLDNPEIRQYENTVETAVSKVIPPEEAFANFETLFNGIYGDVKSAMPTCNASSLEVFGGAYVKSGNINLPDTTVYLLNFPDSSGFAIMAAQSCMTTPVFCITEKGSISTEDLQQALVILESLNGADTKSMPTDSADNEIISIGEDFVPMLIAASAINQTNMTSTDIPIRKYDGEIPEAYPAYYYKTLQKIGPLLTTKWHQDSPFNDFREDGSPAGCVAIAAAQILTFNGFGSAGGRTFDWELLRTVCPYTNISSNGTEGASEEASDLLELVGSPAYCDIDYSPTGSGAYADGAKRTLRNFGYSNVRKYYGFEDADIRRACVQLNNYLPVYADGQTGFSAGHAWVIDGLYIREARNLTTGEVLRTEHLFHINWGWQGTSDGYYHQGVFDTTQRVTEDQTVDTNNGTLDRCYTWNYRTITYSL